MYSSIRIQGYRGLDSFRMDGLGRVNLLVGKNNCGKTSILECVELLRSAGDPHVLSTIAGRRGEWGHTDDGDPRLPLGARPYPLNVSHLFANREMGGAISVEADRAGQVDPTAGYDKVTVSVGDPSVSEHDERDAALEGDVDADLVLRVEWSNAESNYKTKALVTDEGVLSRPRRPLRSRIGSSPPVEFVRAGGVTAADAARTFSKFVLGPKHEDIKQALRIVEPAIEELAPKLDDPGRFSRDAPGGVVLRLREVTDRVPIGSMGDGAWRMLGLALSMANAEGGVLLVDEIDTGLHYSVMEDMWRMITEQAAELSVQVFATTHSYDCVESLAPIAESEAGDVTIQRIERKRGKAVRFGREAVVALSGRRVEVR